MSVSPKRMIGLCTVQESQGAWHRLGKSTWEIGKKKKRKKTDKNSGCVCFGCLLKSSYLIDLEGQVDLCQAEVPYCPISRKRDMMSSTDSGGLGCNKSLGDCWCHQLKLATSYIIVKGCYMHSCFPPNFPEPWEKSARLDLESVNYPHPSGSASSSCRSASSSKCAGISFQTKCRNVKTKFAEWCWLLEKIFHLLRWPANTTTRLQGGYIITNNQQ